MILLLICFILEILVISSVALKSQLEDAFSDPNWLSFDEPINEKERLEMENEEFNWGHNVRNYMEEEA